MMRCYLLIFHWSYPIIQLSHCHYLHLIFTKQALEQKKRKKRNAVVCGSQKSLGMIIVAILRSLHTVPNAMNKTVIDNSNSETIK